MEIACEEITINVPWGTVAGKTWGDNSNPYVLAFHGVQDNAGSFDRIIPHLPQHYFYICLDLPGHGRSSHFPPHLPVHTIDYLIFYKLMVKHFNKDKYIIIGHSYGGQIGALFTRLYPDYVDKLILLDTVHSMPVPVNFYHSYLQEKIDSVMKIDEKLSKDKPPTYTYEEALYKVLNQRHYGKLTEESAKHLLARGLVLAEDGKYYFSVDQRMKCFINPMQDFRYILEYLKKTPFRCPVLIILGTDSELQLTYMKPVIKLFEKSKSVYVKYIPGHHDVHMNNPELVSKYITTFLRQNKSKL